MTALNGSVIIAGVPADNVTVNANTVLATWTLGLPTTENVSIDLTFTNEAT